MDESSQLSDLEDTRRLRPNQEKGNEQTIQERMAQAEADIRTIKDGAEYQISSDVEGSRAYWRRLSELLQEVSRPLAEEAARIAGVFEQGERVQRKTIDRFVQAV